LRVLRVTSVSPRLKFQLRLRLHFQAASRPSHRPSLAPPRSCPTPDGLSQLPPGELAEVAAAVLPALPPGGVADMAAALARLPGGADATVRLNNGL
jgi:hypothetical protein